MNVVELNNVNYKNPSIELKNISFNIPRGFVTGFIGANGSGKTTIIRLIMGLLEASSGTIQLFNRTMDDAPQYIKDKIGFVYSDIYANPDWTIDKLEYYTAPFYNQWDTKCFNDYLRQFHLNKQQKIKMLSSGMKMKLSLALALSHHAELFVFDEPTSGLDPVARNEVLTLIQHELLDEQKTVLMSTHIMSDLEKIADYLVYLKHGEILLTGECDALLAKYDIVKGDAAQLDSELDDLLDYKEIRHTGYLGLTSHGNTFKELFGHDVELYSPTIEELMIYLDKGQKNNLSVREDSQ